MYDGGSVCVVMVSGMMCMSLVIMLRRGGVCRVVSWYVVVCRVV